MKLIPNAAKVARKAWSPRLIGLGVLIQAAEDSAALACLPAHCAPDVSGAVYTSQS